MALTATEEKTAFLTATGHSNRKIAELLGVSQRSVEKTLYTAYGKLNIHNRTELVLLRAGKTNFAPSRYYSTPSNLKFAPPAYKKAVINKQKRLRIVLAINHLSYKCRCNKVSSKREWLQELNGLIEIVMEELKDF